MHSQILRFLSLARAESGVPDSLLGLRVVEFGSFNMNGSPREIFTGAGSWTGVDWRAGPGVDLISLAHEAEVGPAEIVISCQALEHDPFWEATVRKGCSLLQRGGWLFLTWAGPGYDPHELATAPAWEGEGAYYRNLSTEEVAEIVRASLPEGAEVRTSYDRGTLDALLWARVPFSGGSLQGWLP